MLRRLLRSNPTIKCSWRWCLAGNTFPKVQEMSWGLRRSVLVGEKGQAVFRWTSVWENPQPVLLVLGKEVHDNKVARGICGVLT